MFEVRARGYKQDKDSEDDWAFGEHPKLANALPSQCTLRHLMGAVLDQGALGSCAAHAISKLVYSSHMRQGIALPIHLSRLALWYCGRAIDGDELQNAGMSIRDGFRVLNILGFAPEHEWPYSMTETDGRFKMMPPTEVFRKGHDQRKPTEYRRITSVGWARVAEVKQAVASGLPVAFGTRVTERFANNNLNPTEPLGIPADGEAIAGGHAMVIAGFRGDTFEVLNSWGPDFGEGGWFIMDSSYLMWERTRDLWVAEHAPPFQLYSED